LQYSITFSGEFLLMDSLTLWPLDLMKKDSSPAPGPALGVVVLAASRNRRSSMRALPMLISSALVSAFISMFFSPIWTPDLLEGISFFHQPGSHFHLITSLLDNFE
jgi:hypothetical protein